MHCAAYGTEQGEVGIGDEHNEHLLDKMEDLLPLVFSETAHPVQESHLPFTPLLLDPTI